MPCGMVCDRNMSINVSSHMWNRKAGAGWTSLCVCVLLSSAYRVCVCNCVFNVPNSNKSRHDYPFLHIKSTFATVFQVSTANSNPHNPHPCKRWYAAAVPDVCCASTFFMLGNSSLFFFLFLFSHFAILFSVRAAFFTFGLCVYVNWYSCIIWT